MELCMSLKERDRLRVLHDLSEGRLKQTEAAEVMGVGTRQARRLLRRYENKGDAGIVHGLRNRSSNRKIPQKVKARVLNRVSVRYRDFGPTLAAEYLEEEDGLIVSRETLRGWMVEAGLWIPRKRRVRHRQWRERKACFGELVQLDTSIHDWLEGRGDSMVLISMIDDATSRLFAHFFPNDSTATNMRLIWSYLVRFGRPLAIYADKAGHFKARREPTAEEALNGREAETQIQRALRELGIQYLAAHSPQAKGRVERSFETAQDRLIKGMRLEAVKTVEEANHYLRQRFLPLWNRRFTVEPASPADVHRPVEGYDFKVIFSVQTTRTVANDYTIRHEGDFYQIRRTDIVPGLRGAKVTVEKHLSGQLKIRWRQRILRYRKIDPARIRKKSKSRQAATPLGLRPRSVAACAKSRIPRPDHPWRNRTVLSGRKADISTLR